MTRSGETLVIEEAASAEADAATFAASLRDWFGESADELAPFRGHSALAIEDEVAHGAKLQQLLWDAGWLRHGWPVDCGGLGGGVLHRAVVYDELWAAGYPLPEGMAGIEVMVPALVKYARPLAQEHAADYVRGATVWCQGFSEPDAGSDLASLRTRAVPDGDGFRVAGEKVWSSLASCATHCFLLARTGEPGSGHRGLSMFFVDLDSPGVTVRPTRAASGRNDFGEIYFEDAFVPRSRLIGEPGQGWEISMYLLQWERGMYGWQRQAYLRRRLEEAVSSARGRSDVDVDRVGRAYLALYALRAGCRRTVRELAFGGNPGPNISPNKLALSTAEQAVFDAVRSLRASQIELGDGDAAEHLRAEYFYTRVTSVYGGSAEIQRNIVAERILGLPQEPRYGR